MLKNKLRLNIMLQLFAYNSVIDRADSQALIPEDVAKEIIQGIPQYSAVMAMATKAPNMSRAQRRLPVLSSLPTAYFVNGDTGLKQTSEQIWANKYLNAEELAVIIPIPEAVLDDVDYDIWAEVKPRIMEAMGVAFDQAVLFGINAPATWPTNILQACIDGGNAITLGTNVDLYDDLLGENGVISVIEADGFMATGHIAAMKMRGKYRGLRSTDGEVIFKSNMQDSTKYDLDGSPITFPKNGSIIDTSALQISGDFSQLIYSMRTDITYKILTEAVIQDGAGAIVYNLAQQDMVALRAVIRLAWQVPNPINRVNATGSRFPFAALRP